MKKLFGRLTQTDHTFNLITHIAVPVVLCAILVIFQFKGLQDDKQHHLEQAQLNAHDLGSTMAISIAGSFENIDLTLQSAVDHVERWSSATDSIGVNPTLHKLQNRVPSVILLRSTDAQGNIVFYSSPDEREMVNVADREYFLALKNNPHAGMVMSQPVPGRISKRWVLVCARRLNRPDGKFAGIVFASVDLEGYLNRLAGGEIKLSGDDVFLLRDDAGNALIRYANGRQDMDVIGTKVDSDNLSRLAKTHAENGTYVSNSAVDNIERIYYYQRISDRPMNLVVGISVKDALNAWQHESEKIWMETVALTIAILAAGAMVYRTRQRQLETFSEIQKIQTQLQKTNLELARLSATDGLTGLANRRKFDEVGPHEWQRAMRNQESLAVAMVDVDFFKIFNDRYGHQAGDQCLVAIAAALTNGLRDGSDFIARYGGEEFVILLPGQDARGAFDVLERLRCDVEALTILHGGSEVAPVITTSAGFAAIIPGPTLTFEQLIEQADQNLYAAKRRGKNQVVGAAINRMWSKANRKIHQIVP
ncbi:diguanylate cyclase (GGDEF)-like protein [Oxalobacteraceae bacterium GrIS 2.11]